MSSEIGAWWRIADHTQGNETGRMMIVNGFNPGSVFFRDTVAVQPNTNYLFTAWIMNLFKVTGYPNPELSVRILDEDDNVLYSAPLGILIPPNVNAPEWKQIGSVINSQDNTSLTVEFLSEGPEVIGNDYAIDDVAFQEIQIRQFTPVKTVSASSVSVGEVFDYTVTLTDTCANPLTEVFFRDLLPVGVTFVPGSVRVNGATFPSANPNTGFSLPDIPGGQSVTVTFSATATSIPAQNPTLNRASITYSYTPVEGGIPAVFQVESNEVPVLITGTSADISVTKTASAATLPGRELTYTLTVANAGPSSSENVILTDNIPSSITDAQYSTDNGTTFSPWTGSLNLGTIAAGASRTIIIRGTISPQAQGTITNTASVTSTTPDPNPDNNTSTITTNILTPRCQALIDLIDSVALQEAALARILNAEGQKMQAFINMEDVTNDELFELNRSVTSMIGAVSRLEIVLQAKLQNVSCQLEGCLDPEA